MYSSYDTTQTNQQGLTLSSSKGFTLIELLVVIAIIGILSSVVLASLNSAREKSRDARRQADMQQISLAVQLLYDSCGGYPAPGPSHLDVSDSGGSCGNEFGGNPDMGDFIQKVPNDPQGDRYGYAVSSDGQYYCLGTSLEGADNDPLTDDVPQNHNPDCVDGDGSPADLGSSYNYAISP